ncbi:MAG: MBL fold metallo-hydrolase, partial [Candidatus Binataceae bacterium]
MIVDSCVDSRTGIPVALEYLRAQGFDPSVSVKLLVLSHWHNDHIRGAAAILREARSAEFFCSAALQQREYLELVAAGTLERVGDS